MANLTEAVETALQNLHTPKHLKTDKHLGTLAACTLLDLSAGSSVALIGTPEGRLVVALSASGPWKPQEFREAVKAPGKTVMQEFVYRHSYDGARRVRILWDNANKAWLTGGAEDADPKSVGRATPALAQEEFEAGLSEMATSLLTEKGIDNPALADELAKLIQAISRHSFNRAWKEQGYGWL